MLRPRCLLSHTFATLLAATMLTACSTDPAAPPEAVIDPGPGETTLQLDFAHIEVIKDCDGIEGDGDFSFQVTTSLSSGGGGTVHRSSPRMGPGERTSAIGRRSYTVPATSGQQVTVEFIASEIDKDILGRTYNDSRLSNARRTSAHRFNNGRWSGLGPQTITLGSGDCQVRLSYTANAN